jgi:hypothetical protein
MAVRIIQEERPHRDSEGDYLHVRTFAAPDDDTVTLATIERVVDKNFGRGRAGPAWHVRTIVLEKPMSPAEAVGFATCYAQRKGISVICKSS